MGNAATETSRQLADRAKQGDTKAGKKLITLCRDGMLKPFWEKEPTLDAEAVRRHLDRRIAVGSGKGTM